MPGFDGTGPRGLGPMTGGRRGFCNPNYAGMGTQGSPYARPYGWGAPYGGYGMYPNAPYQAYPYGGYGGFGWGRGMGRGFGMGRGRGMGRGFGW